MGDHNVTTPTLRIHLYLFLIGWAYYLLIPTLAGRFGFFDSLDSFALMSRYADPSAPWWTTLIVYILVMPVMFFTGSRLAHWLPRLRTIETPQGFPTRILLPLYGLMLAVSAFAARAYLFKGYAQDVDSSVLGPIATLQMALLLQYLYAKSSRLKTARWGAILLSISSILLLSMGGRLYVVSSLLAVYIYWWVWSARNGKSRLRSLLILIVAPFILAAIGMWRMGGFDPSMLLFFMFAESMFSSISTFTLMSNVSHSLIAIPSDFLSAFYNIVPTVLWPGKAMMITSLADNPSLFESPLGGLSIVVSTIGNFGLLGGPLFVSAVGFMMGRAALGAQSLTGRALYCYLCCLIPFEFFRDPFQVQVKLVVTGFLLFWLNRILTLSKSKSPI